jgi:hypothetical protein
VALDDVHFVAEVVPEDAVEDADPLFAPPMAARGREFVGRLEDALGRKLDVVRVRELLRGPVERIGTDLAPIDELRVDVSQL